jgi:hypothetical protein
MLLHYTYILTATVDHSALPGAVLLSCCAVLWPHTHARTDMSGVWFVWLTRHDTTRQVNGDDERWSSVRQGGHRGEGRFSLFRGMRYAPTYAGLQGRDMTPKGTLEQD